MAQGTDFGISGKSPSFSTAPRRGARRMPGASDKQPAATSRPCVGYLFGAWDPRTIKLGTLNEGYGMRLQVVSGSVRGPMEMLTRERWTGLWQVLGFPGLPKCPKLWPRIAKQSV